MARQHGDQRPRLLVHVVVRRLRRSEPGCLQSGSQDCPARDSQQQYAVIAPTLHCSYKRAAEDTVVGERSMGDARLNYDEMTYAWFDHFLKGESNGVLEKMPRVRY